MINNNWHIRGPINNRLPRTDRFRVNFFFRMMMIHHRMWCTKQKIWKFVHGIWCNGVTANSLYDSHCIAIRFWCRSGAVGQIEWFSWPFIGQALFKWSVELSHCTSNLLAAWTWNWSSKSNRTQRHWFAVVWNWERYRWFEPIKVEHTQFRSHYPIFGH